MEAEEVMGITVDSIAIALSGMPGEAFFAADPIVRDSFRHQAIAVKTLIDAAFAAGREEMREECAVAMNELCAKYLGNAAACVNKSDTRTALDMADAFDRASIAIRALAGKEG